MKRYNGLSLQDEDVVKNASTMLSAASILLSSMELATQGIELVDITLEYLNAASDEITNFALEASASTIGERIYSARKSSRHTQTFVAAAVGVTAAAISQWEAGVTEPSWRYIIPLSITLKCDPAWLLTGNDELKAIDSANEILSNGCKNVNSELTNSTKIVT